MGDVLAFWIVALVVGAFGFPVAAALLRRLPDAGAGLSFALGLVLCSYGYFVLRVLSILPPGRAGYILAVALLAIVAAATAARDRWLIVTWYRAWPGLVVAAGVFTFAFFGYVAFRSYNAEIGGTEQPMDFMYLNATLTSPEYPPNDPWLAGEQASYYYFGYVQAGLLTAVSGVPASTGYNLSLAYTFAASAAGAASLGFALVRWIVGARGRRWAMAGGAVAIGLLLFVGSLSAVFEWSAAHGNTNRGLYEAFGVEWMIPCEPGQSENCYTGQTDPRTSRWYPTEFWFWWRGSRIIPDTITEFPFFSFLLGDLHPHVMSLPLVLLALGAAAALWRGRSWLDWRCHRRDPFAGLALAVIFGALAFQNAWDVITFSALLGLAVFARNFRRAPPLPALLGAASFLAPVAAVAVVGYAPWWLTFGSQAQGFHAYVGEGTRPGHAFLQFGPLLGAGMLTTLFAMRCRPPAVMVNVALGTAWIPLLPFAGWLALAAARGELSAGLDARGTGGWVTLSAYAFAVWILAWSAVVLAMSRNAAAPAAALAAAGALLLYGSELFLIRDVFFGSVPRLNTVFKLSYQAWVLLALAGAAGMAAGLQRAVVARRASAFLALPVGWLAVGGLVYPLLAAFNRTDNFSLPTSIDGLAAVARNDPNDYALTLWIQQHTAPGDVVFEATGRRWQGSVGTQPVIVSANVDYSDAGRIAARTGRQTPIGWYFHEIQWRGDTPENRSEFVRRQDTVDSAYTSQDPNQVIAAMQQFGARYLVVGRVEMANYPGLMPDYSAFLETAFESGAYRVYALPEYRRTSTR
jgi:YYY domain-containing protein